MVNRFVRAVLRSPLHALLSKGLMLITVTGRRSGRSFTFPVQYVIEDEVVLVLVGRAESKRWWRNLMEPAPVTLRIRGRDVDGTAVALTDPEAVRGDLATYVRRSPRAAKALGLGAGEPDPAAVAKAAEANVVVRVRTLVPSPVDGSRT